MKEAADGACRVAEGETIARWAVRKGLLVNGPLLKITAIP